MHNASIRVYFSVLFVFQLGYTALSQYVTVINDNFSDSLKYRDLTQKMIFGSHSLPVSGFRRLLKTDAKGLRFSGITQTDSARKYAGFINPNSTKASLAFDYRFPEIDRNADSVSIEFDVLWDLLVSGGNPGRIVVALMHGLPENIPVGTILDSLTSASPFGRPAYSFRILNRIPQGANNYANMMYGGGRDSLGEFEKYQSGNNQWWLPGFISGPGGISPESNMPQYPLGPVNRWSGYTLASATSWQHFTWKIFPEKLEVWTRSSALAAGNDTLVMRMVTPKPGPLPEMLAKLQLGHNLPVLPDSLPTNYYWFPKVNGLRFYMNGQNQTYFANISLKSSFIPLSVKKNRKAEPDFQLYPNPGRETLWIAAGSRIQQVRIFDSMGKLVGFNKSLNQIIDLKISHLPKGIYWIEVEQNDFLTTKRWSKE